MAKKKVEEVAEEIALPILNKLQYELVDIEYKKEGSSWCLRFYIDKEGGITLDDCQQASQQISDRLDKIDPIPHNYFLEVSSPGLDRPLKKDKDFEKYKGHKVDVNLYRAINGLKSFTGELEGMQDGKVLIKIDKEIISFNRNEIAIIRLAIEF